MPDFTPINSLERTLIKVQRGELPRKLLYALLLSEDLAVPSRTEVQADGSGFSPLIYERQGISRVAVFTHPSRTADIHGSASYLLVSNGLYILKRFPPDLGLVCNPGFPVGFEMPASGLQSLLRDFTT